MITLCVETALYNTSFKERWKKLEDDEENVGSYRTTSRKREGTAVLKRKHWLAPCGELAWNNRLKVSQDRLVSNGLLQLTQYR
jgi:hypothetical protein